MRCWRVRTRAGAAGTQLAQLPAQRVQGGVKLAAQTQQSSDAICSATQAGCARLLTRRMSNCGALAGAARASGSSSSSRRDLPPPESSATRGREGSVRRLLLRPHAPLPPPLPPPLAYSRTAAQASREARGSGSADCAASTSACSASGRALREQRAQTQRARTTWTEAATHLLCARPARARTASRHIATRQRTRAPIRAAHTGLGAAQHDARRERTGGGAIVRALTSVLASALPS